MQALWIHVPLHPPRRIGVEAPVLTVGRTPENGLMLNDPAISRTHARFDWEAGRLWLRDLGSRHGTFVNGRRLQSPQPVAAGDDIRLGPLVLRLEADTPPAPAPPASLTRTVALADLRHVPETGDRGWHGALDLLHTLSMDLVQEASPDAMVERLLQRLSARLQARQASALLREVSGRIRILDRTGTEIQAPEGLTTEMVDAAFQRQEASLVLNPGETSGSSTTSSMTVPLEHQGEVFGLLHFRSDASNPFQADDVRLVATLGNLVAARILHQRALDEVARRQDLERDLEVREAATRARATFLATLSHELRSPLQAILGYHHLAQNEARPERVAEHLRRAEQSGRLLMDLVNDILDFSKVEQGRLTLEAVPFRLRDVLETVEAMFRPQAEAKGLLLECHVDGAVPAHLQGDPLRLGQVLINLVGNAVKFTAEGSVELVVTLPTGEDTLVFEVADTGIGLSPEDQTGIFEPYQQAGAHTARRFGGTGLGLAISHQLVTLMGGTLSVQSILGQGSIFRFELPFHEGGDNPTALEAEHRALCGRVLVVEDDLLNRELVLHVLHTAGLQAEGAATATEALHLFEQATFHALVTDLSLPDFDGLELASRIRALPGGANLPMIALTGHDTADTKARCQDVGLLGHLVKPVRPPALLNLLRPWLQCCDTPRLEQDDPALYAELVGIFLEEHARAAEEVQQLLAQGARQAAMDACHAVKGACMALETTPAVEAWSALERQLRDEGTLEPCLAMAVRAHSALIATLQARQDLASS